MSDQLASFTPLIFSHVMALCMALAFVVADGESRTSRALATGFALYGSDAVSEDVLRALGLWPASPWWSQELTPGHFYIIAFAEWFLLILRTVPTRDRWTRLSELLLRFCQGTAVVYIPLNVALHGSKVSAELAWQIVMVVALISFALAMLILLIRQPDLQEKQRVLGAIAAVPIFLLSVLVPGNESSAMLNVVGFGVFLVGALKYHVMQGQRGQFLARFLSPQVGELVRAQGLLQALHQNQLEITTVCCDLRGFTAYSQVHSSDHVVGVLHDYYNVVSAVVAKHGGTIKDFAGDGILILVGAPLTFPDHAPRALEIAKGARDAARLAIRKWATPETPLGMGVGVASGRVTVGVIDAASRLEYTAVGPAVNLSARLCARAADGEIRVSERTAELAGKTGLEECAPEALKGFGDAVLHFAVPA